MPRESPFWTRKLELELINFVRTKDVIWKPAGNTNHDIQLKYRAYAEFAAKIGKGFTASSVRDRWVNIRSTFNHNLRKVKRSELSPSGKVYVPCWLLWKPLQFLRDSVKMEPEMNQTDCQYLELKTEEIDANIKPNQLNMRTDRPRNRKIFQKKKSSECVEVINNLIDALNPLMNISSRPNYWYFGKHVTERLDCMREVDAQSASQEIMRIVNNWVEADVT